MTLVRVSIPTAACLLLASVVNATAESQSPIMETTHSILGDSVEVASEHEPNSNLGVEDLNKKLSAEEDHFREADFGPGDPGVTVIANNEGGLISSYETAFFGAGSGNRLWAVDGHCNSACTMVLGTGRVCATPRAQFGFHAGYNSLLLFAVIAPQATYQMYEHYPDDVKAWVDAHHAMDQIGMTMMRQPEVATYVPTCKGSGQIPQIYSYRPRLAEPSAGPNSQQIHSPAPQPYTGPYAQDTGPHQPHVYSGPTARMRWIVGPLPCGM
jgi:hypothetical protein